jgi:hypothetical protein
MTKNIVSKYDRIDVCIIDIHGNYYTMHAKQICICRRPTIMKVPRDYEDLNQAWI